MSAGLARARALFVLSGAAALALEAACYRACALLFGATHAASGAVLAGFMGGLALGSALGARVAPALGRRFVARAYALCELLVAAWALALPPLLDRAQTLAAQTSPAGRVLLAFGLLVPGTVAMGATTPLLAESVLARRASLRGGLAALYSANLFGGALGALGAGFLALPALGLARTMRIAAALACVTGALAWALLRPSGPLSRATTLGDARDSSEENQREITLDGDPSAALVLVGLGFASFALQVAQHRVFALLLGSAAYTFALVTAVTLVALALGGRAGGRDERDRNAERLGEDPLWTRSAKRLLWIAIATYLGQLVVRVAPFYLRASVASGSSALSVGFARVLVVALVVFGAAYHVGALFPALASRCEGLARRASPGRTAGIATLASTVGNVAGALVAGFVVIPSWGVQRAMELPAALALALAVFSASRAGGWALRSLGLSSVLALGFALWARGAWDPVALSAGSYRVAANRALLRRDTTREDASCGPERRLRGNHVLYARDGALGTVLVLAHPGGDDCTLYSLRVDGKAEGSAYVRAPLHDRVRSLDALVPAGDLPSETLAGWLPIASAREFPVHHAFVVGWGTGLSVRALLDAGALRVTAAELEPAVLEAGALFDREALTDLRVTLVRDDARMALRRDTQARYDVIVSHPSNPWVTGASALFSLEYFGLLRARLAPGGRVVAWVQLYETDRDAVRALVHTFSTVFADTYAFRPGPASRDLFLIGAPSRGTLPATREDFGAAFERWHTLQGPRGARLLRWLGVDTARRAADFLRADARALRAWSEGVPVVRDDSAALEYRVADQLLAGASPTVDALLMGL